MNPNHRQSGNQLSEKSKNQSSNGYSNEIIKIFLSNFRPLITIFRVLRAAIEESNSVCSLRLFTPFVHIYDKIVLPHRYEGPRNKII